MRPAPVFALIAVGSGTANRYHPPQPVVVFAAASLAEPFRELADSLRRGAAPLEITFNFAGSQTLALQLQEGAAADVFASADQRWMRTVAREGLVIGTPGLFARNRLAVIVPAANPGHVASLRDLARRGVKLDLAADAVPAGHYSRQALARLAGRAGLPADYASAVMANIVSNEENVEAVAAKVSLGEADAGIVYRSDAIRLGTRVRVIDIPGSANVVAEYPVAMLRDAAHAAAGQVFIEALMSPMGQRILAAHGFDQVIDLQ
ncbi:MAG: molybdate ABC transporter substrate-binding protein [Gemmatimonadales bacterium]